MESPATDPFLCSFLPSLLPSARCQTPNIAALKADAAKEEDMLSDAIPSRAASTSRQVRESSTSRSPSVLSSAIRASNVDFRLLVHQTSEKDEAESNGEDEMGSEDELEEADEDAVMGEAGSVSRLSLVSFSSSTLLPARWMGTGPAHSNSRPHSRPRSDFSPHLIHKLTRLHLMFFFS